MPDIFEINNINVDNLATTSLDVDNTSTSDELDVGENNVEYKANAYAESKRSNKVTTLVLLSVSLFAGGSTISNIFVGNNPIINNFATAFSVNENIFSYELDIEIDQTHLMMTIESESYSYQKVFSSTNVYKDSLVLEKGNYQINFVATNNFDYNQNVLYLDYLNLNEKYHVLQK